MPGFFRWLGASLGLVQRQSPVPDVLTWPGDHLIGLYGGTPGNTGIPVGPMSALQSAAVYRSIKVKAEDIAKLPFRVQHNDGHGNWQTDRRHAFNAVLARPNRFMTRFEFWRMMVASLDLRGNAIAIIKRGFDGRPVELLPVIWDRVGLRFASDGTLVYNVFDPRVGTNIPFPEADVLHLRGLTLDGGYIGLSPIAVARDVIGLAIAMQQHGAVLFRQGAQVAGIIKHPGRLSDEALKRLKATWQDSYGGVQNAAKTAVLEEGMSFEKLTMTNEDSQFLQGRQLSVIEIGRIFGVPPHKLYDLSKASFSTLEQQERAYVLDTLTSIATNIQDALNLRAFFDGEEEDYRVVCDFSARLKADLAAQTAFFGSALNNGYLSVNDVRHELGLPPIADGDTYRVPVNTQPIGQSPAASSSAGIGSQAISPNDEPATQET